MVRNVADLVTPPRRAHTEKRTLDEEETRCLLDAAREDRLEALYVLAITAGMRQGELLGLRWRDVDLELSRLAVTGTLQRIRGEGLTVAEPKTARSRRRVQLSQAAVKALRRRRVLEASERLTAGSLWDGSLDLVFPNLVGRPIEANNLVRRSFEPLLYRAGLPGSTSMTSATPQPR